MRPTKRWHLCWKQLPSNRSQKIFEVLSTIFKAVLCWVVDRKFWELSWKPRDTVSLFLFFSLCLIPSPSPFLCLCLCLSPSLFDSLSLHLCLSLYVFLCFSLLSVRFCLYLFISTSLFPSLLIEFSLGQFLSHLSVSSVQHRVALRQPWCRRQAVTHETCWMYALAVRVLEPLCSQAAL